MKKLTEVSLRFSLWVLKNLRNVKKIHISKHFGCVFVL